VATALDEALRLVCLERQGRPTAQDAGPLLEERLWIGRSKVRCSRGSGVGWCGAHVGSPIRSEPVVAPLLSPHELTRRLSEKGDETRRPLERG
jgi:hypothetical protein